MVKGSIRPLVSLVVSAYNAESTIRAMIQSILDQSYDQFELIVVNDGSTDGTQQIIEQFGDSRLRAWQQENIGLTRTLNRAIALSKGELIARIDADDTAHPERLEKQVAWFLANPDGVLCGTFFEGVSLATGQKELRRSPCDHFAICKGLVSRGAVFRHSTVMFRKDAFDRAGGYNEAFRTAQDYELWPRLARLGKVAILPEVLVEVRVDDPNSVSGKRSAWATAMLHAQLRILAWHRLGFPWHYLIVISLRSSRSLGRAAIAAVKQKLGKSCHGVDRPSIAKLPLEGSGEERKRTQAGGS